MDIIQTLTAVSNQLKTLFADKGELKGFNDWYAFISCAIEIDQVVEQLKLQQESPTTGE